MSNVHTRSFTASEVEDLVFESEVYREEGEDRRWSRTNFSVVEADDGKLYGIHWEEGLTEMQDNMFDLQESYEEVFERVRFRASREVTYHTADNMKTLGSNIHDEIESLRLVGDEEQLNTALDAERKQEIDEALKLFEKLQGLDHIHNFEAVRMVAMDYLKTIREEL